MNFPRCLEFSQAILTKLDEFGLGGFAAQDHGSVDFFPVFLVGHPETKGLGDCRMLEKDSVHFERRDLFTATIYYFLEASRNCQESLLVEAPLIPCPEPAGREGGDVCLRIIAIGVRYT